MNSRRFAHSFVPIVSLKAGEECTLKRHHRGALREVIGFLNMLANNDQERFVFPEVDAIVEGCKKYASKTVYDARIIKYALAELRARHIISKRLTRIRSGMERLGFIVAPHDCLAVRSGSQCNFEGQLRAPGRWERSPGTACSVHSVYRPDCSNCKHGVIFWAGFPQSASVAIACAAAVAIPAQTMESALDCAPESALDCALENSNCALNCALEKEKVPPQTDDNETAYGPERAPNLGNLSQSTVGTVLTPLTLGSPSNQAQGQYQKRLGRTDSLSATDQNQGTIGQHFSELLASDDELFVVGSISDGEIDKGVADKYSVRYGNWPQLVKCCRDAIKAKAGQPYLGRKTNGDLMADAMTRLKERSNKFTPRYWYPVVKRLRESGGTKVAPVIKTGDRWAGPVLAAGMAATGETLDRHRGQLLEISKAVEHYRHGWEVLNVLTIQHPNDAGLARLRQWFWESDCLPDKPVPPWSLP
jgi:hypothetical protein